MIYLLEKFIIAVNEELEKERQLEREKEEFWTPLFFCFLKVLTTFRGKK